MLKRQLPERELAIDHIFLPVEPRIGWVYYLQNDKMLPKYVFWVW